MRILVRFSGEIAIKSQHVRKQFLSRLMHNIRAAIRESGFHAKTSQERGRIWVEGDDPSITDMLSRVFGVQSCSPVEYSCEAETNAILTTGSAYLPQVEGRSFAVRVRRQGRHPFTSVDIQNALGALLNKSSGTVRLKDPELTVNLEIRDQRCFFYSQVIRGPGGMPLGTGGRAVCLMSGGFDSPVAAWMMQKRGVSPDYLLCNLGGTAYERSVLQVCRRLASRWSYGTSPAFYVIDFTDVVDDLKKRVPAKYTQVLLKRLFYRAGGLLAEEAGACAMLTGEAVAQVSSQTLTNLRAIDDAATFPVMRPLIAANKEDIVDLSRQIGTWDLSSGIREFCQITSVKPATACSVERAREEESKLDHELLLQAFRNKKIMKPKAMSHQDMTTPYIYSDQVSANSIIVDCRSQAEFDQDHYPGAAHIDYHELMANWGQHFTRKDKVLLYCSVGVQSAILAEKMQLAGYEAYSFRGGSERLLSKGQVRAR